MEKTNLAEYANSIPRLTYTRKPVVDAFVGIMDKLARANNCICWIEKTPGHIFVVDKIEKHVSGARFIHVLRDGRAVVASLMDAHRRFPEIWKEGRIEKLVELWNSAIRESTRWVGKENHFFISYEALTDDPTKELNAICRFLSLEFEEKILDRYQEEGQRIVRSEWHWVKGVTGPIKATELEKYNSVLTDSEREYVERHLIQIPEALRRAMNHG